MRSNYVPTFLCVAAVPRSRDYLGMKLNYADEPDFISLAAATRNALLFMMMPARSHRASNAETSASKSSAPLTATATGGSDKSGAVAASAAIAGASADSNWAATTDTGHTLGEALSVVAFTPDAEHVGVTGFKFEGCCVIEGTR